MGFKVGRVFTLDFADTDAAGAVVKVRSIPIGELMSFTGMTRQREAEELAKYLVEWNLEDDNGPLPLTAEGVLSLEEPFMDFIYVEWLRATRGISVPFAKRSAGGGRSPTEDEPAPFIQMEPLSDSPPTP